MEWTFFKLNICGFPRNQKDFSAPLTSLCIFHLTLSYPYKMSPTPLVFLLLKFQQSPLRGSRRRWAFHCFPEKLQPLWLTEITLSIGLARFSWRFFGRMWEFQVRCVIWCNLCFWFFENSKKKPRVFEILVNSFKFGDIWDMFSDSKDLRTLRNWSISSIKTISLQLTASNTFSKYIWVLRKYKIECSGAYH